MPKEYKGFACDNCEKIHTTMDLAIKCEENHIERMKDSKIDSYTFAQSRTSFRADPVVSGIVPKTIRIKFSEKQGDFAVYSFSHLGFKGL